MSRVCAVCGKGVLSGHNVSHAQNRSQKKFKPNLRKVRLNIEGELKRIRICAQCLRSTKKVAQ